MIKKIEKNAWQSSVLRGGSILSPFFVDISDEYVTISRQYMSMFTTVETVITISKIAAVKIHRHLIGTNIEIIGYSPKAFALLQAFSYADAQLIKDIILNKQKLR